MPQIPVNIDEVEELDKKISDMCKEKAAILVQDGGTFSNIFPKATDRAKKFRKKYLIALNSGSLLFTHTAEVSLMFDYREMKAQVQITRRDMEDIDNIFPEIRQYLYRICKLAENINKIPEEHMGLQKAWVVEYIGHRKKFHGES